MTEKIQKVLASLGLGSRRQIETWILQGRIAVNGKLAQLGDRITKQDKVCLDNKLLLLSKITPFKRRLIIYYKPEGEVCTRSDPENRPTVFSHLPALNNERWIMVGRLDINSQGLLLFTNDGVFAHQLAHPSFGLEREYAVRILGHVDQAMLMRLKSGVKLEDGMAAFKNIQVQKEKVTRANQWFHVTLNEGRHREVRRLWESQGVKVSRLIRIRFGNILLPSNLRRGQWQELTAKEVDQLKEHFSKK